MTTLYRILRLPPSRRVAQTILHILQIPSSATITLDAVMTHSELRRCGALFSEGNDNVSGSSKPCRHQRASYRTCSCTKYHDMEEILSLLLSGVSELISI